MRTNSMEWQILTGQVGKEIATIVWIQAKIDLGPELGYPDRPTRGNDKHDSNEIIVRYVE